MSVLCGNCGEIIFVSARKDWKTNKERPEITCGSCGGYQEITIQRPTINWEDRLAHLMR